MMQSLSCSILLQKRLKWLIISQKLFKRQRKQTITQVDKKIKSGETIPATQLQFVVVDRKIVRNK